MLILERNLFSEGEGIIWQSKNGHFYCAFGKFLAGGQGRAAVHCRNVKFAEGDHKIQAMTLQGFKNLR